MMPQIISSHHQKPPKHHHSMCQLKIQKPKVQSILPAHLKIQINEKKASNVTDIKPELGNCLSIK